MEAWYRLKMNGLPGPPNAAGENCWRSAEEFASATGKSLPRWT